MWPRVRMIRSASDTLERGSSSFPEIEDAALRHFRRNLLVYSLRVRENHYIRCWVWLEQVLALGLAGEGSDPNSGFIFLRS